MVQCPNCGGILKFDIASQQLKCDSCSSLFDPYAFEMHGAEESKDYDVTIFRCTQCGGEILSTNETAAGFCSYCGASNVLESRFTRAERPQLIIPFKKTKKDCVDLFEKFVKKCLFAPNSYKNAGKGESFRGIYMPYWLYDMSQRGNVNVATSTSHRSGDYIITDHYMMRGTLNNYYNGVSYDASSSFADDISRDVAPYDVKDIKLFSPSFLSGYYADLADVTVDTYRGSAVDMAKESTYNYLRKDSPMSKHSFDTPKEKVMSGIVTNINATRSAMFPVWFMSYRTGNRVSYSTINGQTGKITADIPMSIPKYFICAGIVAAILFVIFQLVLTITPGALALIVSVFALICVLTYGSEMKHIAVKENHEDDLGMLNYQKRLEAKKRQNQMTPDGTVVMSQQDLNRAVPKGKKKGSKTGGGIITIIVIVFVALAFFGSTILNAVFEQLESGKVGIVGGVVALVFLIISIVSTVNAKKNIEKMNSKNGLPESIWATISLFILMIVCFWSPASDLYYYGAAVIAMIGVVISLIGIIMSYNLLATRPLPQFELYKGGDDRA